MKDFIPPMEGMPESLRRVEAGENLGFYEPSYVAFTRDENGKIIRIGRIRESDSDEMKSQFAEFSKLCDTQAELDKEMFNLLTNNGETAPELPTTF